MPNVELAAAAGLAVDNGILVNDFMETSAPEILAIGDCVSFDHWELEAPRAPGSRCRTPSTRARPPRRRSSASASPTARCRGSGRTRATSSCRWSACPCDATRSVIRGKPDDGSFSVFHYAGDRLVAIDSVNRAADHVLGRRMIGAGISPPAEAGRRREHRPQGAARGICAGRRSPAIDPETNRRCSRRAR